MSYLKLYSLGLSSVLIINFIVSVSHLAVYFLLDFQKALVRVPKHKLVYKIKQLGTDVGLGDFMIEFTNNRKTVTSVF